jgi:hypothetical protein
MSYYPVSSFGGLLPVPPVPRSSLVCVASLLIASDPFQQRPPPNSSAPRVYHDFLTEMSDVAKPIIANKSISSEFDIRHGHVAREMIRRGYPAGPRGGLIVDGIECSAAQLRHVYIKGMRQLKKPAPKARQTPTKTDWSSPAPIQTTSAMKRGMGTMSPHPMAPRNLMDPLSSPQEVFAGLMAARAKRVEQIENREGTRKRTHAEFNRTHAEFNRALDESDAEKRALLEKDEACAALQLKSMGCSYGEIRISTGSK